MINPLIVLIDKVFDVIYLLFWAYIILSWLPVFIPNIRYNRTYQQAVEFIDTIFEPMFRPIRKYIPPLDLGGAAIDLTPLIFIILILPIFRWVVMQVLWALIQ